MFGGIHALLINEASKEPVQVCLNMNPEPALYFAQSEHALKSNNNKVMLQRKVAMFTFEREHC